MAFRQTKDADGIFKSLFFVYFILTLHVLLIGGLVLMVVFFGGVLLYMPWILLCGTAALSASGYMFYRKIKKEGKTLKEALTFPAFKDRAIEISLLGGLASVKVGKPDGVLGTDNKLPKLEHPDAHYINELKELALLLESNLITMDEYNKAKQKVLK
jgi:hypothetical protein